jgi:TonB family protein
MSEAWKQWEGQVADRRYPLRQYLGGSDHSAVFLTEYGEGEPRKAAVKLIAADPASADLQLSRWKHAAQLFHPHLLRLFEMGRCEIDGNALLYLVMEAAEENLSQILPKRALNAEETRDVLVPVLDALACVHRQGFVLGHLKPANIMAVADKIKLSTDGLQRANETIRIRKPGVYDPPEAASGRLSPASDVWSLGMTLVETLTQRVPVWERIGHADPILPKSLPSPFLEIGRSCLRRDPQLRGSVGDISARLSPSPSASAVRVAPAPVPQKAAVPPRPMKKTQQTSPVRPRAVSLPSYAVPVLAGVLVFAAIVAIPKILNHRPEPQKAPEVAAERSTAQPRKQQKTEKTPASKQSVAPAPVSAQQTGQKTLKIASDKQPIKKEAAAVHEPPPAITPAAEQLKTSATTTVPGEVLNEVLPDVSQKARDTVRGRVRVGVKVHVDPSGNLAGAELDSPGPSKYFAELALKAARRWEFAPAKVDGSAVATDWIVRFEFSQLDTKVFPVQTTPR